MSKGLVSLDIVAEGGRRRPALGPVRRHRRQPAARPGGDPGRPARRGRLGRGRRLLRRHPGADRDERRAEIAAVAFDEADYLAGLGLRPSDAHGEPGYSTLERLWERPTLEVNGIAGGGKYTVIPHVATGARVLPPGPGPGPGRGYLRRSAAHVAEQAARSAPGVTVRVSNDEAAVPAYTIPAEPPGDPGRRPRRWRRSTRASGCCWPCIAGTLPATDLFERVLGAKTLFFSFSTADEKLHAPNEFMRDHAAARGHAGLGDAVAAARRRPHRLAAGHAAQTGPHHDRGAIPPTPT